MPAKYDKPIPALLLTDFYKTCHRAFYNPSTTQLVSYWTPRKSRVRGIDKVVCFWIQVLVKKYLIDHFAVTFFDRPWEDVRAEYVEYIGATFDKEIAAAEVDAFEAVHALGYLPIEIRAVPEGTRVPIGCPMIEFRATEEWSYWVINYLETLCSCNLWMPMTAATIADHNRSLVDYWYDKTVDDDIPRHSAAGDFSMRGMAGADAAVMADAGHLLSFSSTATIPTAWCMHAFYNAPFDICKGTPSTEHSVMESFGQDHELEAYEFIATKARPNGVLSMVSDTWNLWTVLQEYIPALKDKLLLRDGKIVIRPDSGNPADILCGTMDEIPTTLENMQDYFIQDSIAKARALREKMIHSSFGGKAPGNLNYHVFKNTYPQEYYGIVEGRVIGAVCKFTNNQVPDNFETITDYDELAKYLTVKFYSNEPANPEQLGVVRLLWNVVGGTVNSKGYRVLDSHFGTIYGDAITYDSGGNIYSRLEKNGFAANNVILGFGSYTYQYVTRDTFGFALKVTHGILDGKEVPMFKDPITDRGANSAGKKSQRGMCIVTEVDGQLQYTDGHTIAETDAPENVLRPVFKNGELLVDEDFETIRYRLHPNF